MEQVAAEGLDAISEMVRILINEAMLLEREQYLGAWPYEWSPERKGYVNGYKPKTVKTRMSEIQFEVPQVCEGHFYLEELEKGLRSERSLTLTIAEMYVQGVSTRRMAAITEQLCGTAVTSMEVSRATKKLEEAGYIEVLKEFVDRRPRTTLKLTPAGHQAFKKYRKKMRLLLNQTDSS